MSIGGTFLLRLVLLALFMMRAACVDNGTHDDPCRICSIKHPQFLYCNNSLVMTVRIIRAPNDDSLESLIKITVSIEDIYKGKIKSLYRFDEKPDLKNLTFVFPPKGHKISQAKPGSIWLVYGEIKIGMVLMAQCMGAELLSEASADRLNLLMPHYKKTCHCMPKLMYDKKSCNACYQRFAYLQNTCTWVKITGHDKCVTREKIAPAKYSPKYHYYFYY